MLLRACSCAHAGVRMQLCACSCAMQLCAFSCVCGCSHAAVRMQTVEMAARRDRRARAVTESDKERRHPRRSKGDNAKSRNRGTKQPRLENRHAIILLVFIGNNLASERTRKRVKPGDRCPASHTITICV